MAGGKRGGQGGRGAKAGSHRKGATIGSGGQKRRALEGRGPTPPAEDRKGHPAQRRAKRAEAPAAAGARSERRTREWSERRTREADRRSAKCGPSWSSSG